MLVSKSVICFRLLLLRPCVRYLGLGRNRKEMMASPTCGKLPEEHVSDMPTVLVTLNRLACLKRHSDTMMSEFSWPICGIALVRRECRDCASLNRESLITGSASFPPQQQQAGIRNPQI